MALMSQIAFIVERLFFCSLVQVLGAGLSKWRRQKKNMNTRRQTEAAGQRKQIMEKSVAG